MLLTLLNVYGAIVFPSFISMTCLDSIARTSPLSILMQTNKIHYTNSNSLSIININRLNELMGSRLINQPIGKWPNRSANQPASNLADWMDKWTGISHFGLITCVAHVFISLNARKTQQEASWQTTVVIFSPWHERSRPMSNWSTFSKRKLKSNQFKAVLLITRKLFVELWTCL